MSNRTLKLNSIKNLNDKAEQNRKGIEELAKGFYIASFCHYPYEIVPFWFMYGKCANDKKVLFRFKNFSVNIDSAIENDSAWTSDNKILYYDSCKLFRTHIGGMSCNPVNNPNVEARQTIETIRLFDIDYRLPNDEVFRDLKIVANPWASEEFMQEIQNTVEACSLSDDIKRSISIVRSELDGQIARNI